MTPNKLKALIKRIFLGPHCNVCGKYWPGDSISMYCANQCMPCYWQYLKNMRNK